MISGASAQKSVFEISTVQLNSPIQSFILLVTNDVCNITTYWPTRAIVGCRHSLRIKAYLLEQLIPIYRTSSKIWRKLF